MPYKCFADSANVQMICMNFKLFKKSSGNLKLPIKNLNNIFLVIILNLCYIINANLITLMINV